MPGRKWTGEEKANIVLEILTTSTPTPEICRRYNVRPTLVYSWKASFVQAGTRGLSGTDVSDREIWSTYCGTDEAIRTLEMAVLERFPDGVILPLLGLAARSDGGSQYTSDRFVSE